MRKSDAQTIEFVGAGLPSAPIVSQRNLKTRANVICAKWLPGSALLSSPKKHENTLMFHGSREDD